MVGSLATLGGYSGAKSARKAATLSAQAAKRAAREGVKKAAKSGVKKLDDLWAEAARATGSEAVRKAAKNMAEQFEKNAKLAAKRAKDSYDHLKTQSEKRQKENRRKGVSAGAG